MVPFFSCAGSNTGIPIEALTSTDFRLQADALFGFTGSERFARTAPGWLSPPTAPMGCCGSASRWLRRTDRRSRPRRSSQTPSPQLP